MSILRVSSHFLSEIQLIQSDLSDMTSYPKIEKYLKITKVFSDPIRDFGGLANLYLYHS